MPLLVLLYSNPDEMKRNYIFNSIRLERGSVCVREKGVGVGSEEGEENENEIFFWVYDEWNELGMGKAR